jgi:hypothetical protein
MAAGNFPIQVLEKRRQIQTIARLKPYRAAGIPAEMSRHLPWKQRSLSAAAWKKGCLAFRPSNVLDQGFGRSVDRC